MRNICSLQNLETGGNSIMMKGSTALLGQQCCLSFLAEKIFFAGTDGIPFTFLTDVIHHFRGGCLSDFPHQILINIGIFFQVKTFGCSGIEGFHFFIGFAAILTQLVGAAAAQFISGKYQSDGRFFFSAKAMDDLIHICHKSIIIAFPAVTLGAQQMMRS